MENIIKTEYLCPITHLIFYDPVMAMDGIVYENEAISKWFKTKDTSPMTQEEIYKDLYPVRIIKNTIEDYLKNNPEEKVNQYKPDTSHETNKKAIQTILEKKTYDKLMNYTAFSMKIFFTILSKFNAFTKLGSFETISHVIDNCIDIEASNENGTRLVHIICTNSLPKVIEYLLTKNINFCCKNKWHSAPAHKLCSNERIKISTLEAAIPRINDWESFNDKDHTPFYEICHNNYHNPELIKYFIENCLGKNKNDNKEIIVVEYESDNPVNSVHGVDSDSNVANSADSDNAELSGEEKSDSDNNIESETKETE